MTEPAPLWLWKEKVRPEWVDYNGHLNEAFYVLIFSHATDAFMSHIGLEPDAEARKESSVYTLETHVRYLDECKEGDDVAVATQLVGFDGKRYHSFQSMYLAGTERLLATAEMILLHVDMSGPRAAAFPEDVYDRLEAVWQSHRQMASPEGLNGAMGLKRR